MFQPSNQVLKYFGQYNDKVLFQVPNTLFTKLLHHMMSNNVDIADIYATILFKKNQSSLYLIGAVPSANIRSKNMKKGDTYLTTFTVIKNQLYAC